MTVTLTILTGFLILAGIVLAWDRVEQRQRRRDREIVRRITRYLDSLPPARPW